MLRAVADTHAVISHLFAGAPRPSRWPVPASETAPSAALPSRSTRLAERGERRIAPLQSCLRRRAQHSALAEGQRLGKHARWRTWVGASCLVDAE
jgi:hypothetical protein